MKGWRLARADEDDVIVSLIRRLYEEDPSPEPVPEAHSRATLAAFREQPVRGRAVVLEQDGAVRGYALLVSFWSNELGGETCEIDELYVVPEARGSGHATALLSSLVDGGELWPARPAALCLQVTPDNHRARALYNRLGFRDGKNAFMIRRSR